MAFKNGTTYRFINKYYDTHALNVYGTNAASTGRNVCLYTNTTSDIMQKWVVKTSGSGFRMHSAVTSDFVLDCSDGSLSNSYKNNAHLCATSKTSTTDSRVEFKKVSANVYRIYLPGKDKYLTATNKTLVGGLPASTIKTATALKGRTGGQSNVYWASYSSSKKQQWMVSPSVDDTDPDPEPNSQNLIFPVNNVRINVGYKVPIYETDPRTAGYGPHYGSDYLDLSYPSSNNIIASGDGKIYQSGWDDNVGYFACIVYKNARIIKNGVRTTQDITVRYWHMKNLAIPTVTNYNRPKTIYKGDPIGTMGKEGVAASGVHLHVECDTDTTPKYTFWTPTHFRSPNVIQNGTDSTINPGFVFQVGEEQTASILKADKGSWVLKNDYQYIGDYKFISHLL